MKTRTAAFAIALNLALLAETALADPLPGEVPKFQQLPMNGTTIFNSVGLGTQYYGHDNLSTAYWNGAIGGYQGSFMADDFADKLATPVTHITWWGSYPGSALQGGVPRFAIVFEADVPAGGGTSYSRPGTVLSAQTVVAGALSPGSGTFTEKMIGLGGSPQNEPLYQYNAELAFPFPQAPDTVYWLKIVALIDLAVDPGLRWGWHNRDYTVNDPLASALVTPGEQDVQPLVDPTYPSPVWHFQDAAVAGDVMVSGAPLPVAQPVTVTQPLMWPTQYMDLADGPGPSTAPGGNIGQFGQDLAFQLYTVPAPEPTTLSALLLGALAVLRRRRRGQRK